MDLLDKYKKAWKNQPENSQKVSQVDIYKMTKFRSSSIIKWIFLIGLIEFFFWGILNLIVSKTKYIDVYSELKMLNILNYCYWINFCIIFIFLYFFYQNYKAINTADNTKKLMEKIIKTRKTVKYYVLYNIVGGIFMMIIFNVFVFNTPNGIEMLMPEQAIEMTDRTGLVKMFIISQTIIIAITVIFLTLFYFLLYGLLLRKLNKNYKDLAKLDTE